MYFGHTNPRVAPQRMDAPRSIEGSPSAHMRALVSGGFPNGAGKRSENTPASTSLQVPNGCTDSYFGRTMQERRSCHSRAMSGTTALAVSIFPF